MSKDLMHIYLSDHLAGATGGVEVAKRCLSNNRGTPVGDFLQELLPELEADKRALESFMETVGAPRAAWKQRAVWVAEKIGRLKLNGRIRDYSPLSRVLELEGLCLAVEAKGCLWRSLEKTAARSQAHDFPRLLERARSQRERLEQHRVHAVTLALGER
jgi:hypothetical protein